MVIIGAGLAGLAAAQKLCKSKNVSEITIIEAKDTVGGRIKSVYDKETQKLLYEAGPWRVPRNHQRVANLCASLGIRDWELLKTPNTEPFHPPANDNLIPGMSVWESYALEKQNPVEADKIDLHTGYANEMDGASVSYTPTENVTYYTLKNGFSQLPQKLELNLRKDSRITFLTNCRVTGFFKVKASRILSTSLYNVHYTERDTHRFIEKTLQADAIFICVPPSACKDWSILQKHAAPVLNAVNSQPLNHIYAHGAHKKNTHEKNGTSLLAQSISTQYEIIPPFSTKDTISYGWYQVSYSAGRVARFWYNLFLNNTKRFMRVLNTEAKKMGIIETMLSGEIRMHFWENAVHAMGSLRHRVDSTTAIASST